MTQKNSLKIAIFCIDYPTLNAGMSVYDAISRHGHECTLVLTPYTNKPGELARIARKKGCRTIPYVNSHFALNRLYRVHPELVSRKKVFGPVGRAFSTLSRKMSNYNFLAGLLRSSKANATQNAEQTGAGEAHRQEGDTRAKCGIVRIYKEMRGAFREAKPHLISQQRAVRRAMNIIRAEEFDAVIMTHDIEGSITAPFLKACRNLDIPTFLYPYTYPEPHAAFAYFHDDPGRRVNTCLKRIFAYFFPKYVWKEGDVALLYTHLPVILASIYNRTSIPKPWIPFSSRFNSIFLQNVLIYRKFIDLGFDRSILKLTGAPEYDYIHEIREDFDRKSRAIFPGMKIDKDKKTILINVGANGFGENATGNSPIFNNWKEYSQCMEVAIRSLRKEYNIIITFHPRVTEEERNQFPTDGCYVSNADALLNISVADVLLTYAGSSLIYHCLSAGLPVIIFDAHGYNYEEYETKAGVKIFHDKDAFLKYTKDGFNHDDAKAEVISSYQEGSVNVFDGKVSERMISIIRENL